MENDDTYIFLVAIEVFDFEKQSMAASTALLSLLLR